MTLYIRNLLLASVAGLSLVACGGGSTTSPGSAAPVVSIIGAAPTASYLQLTLAASLFFSSGRGSPSSRGLLAAPCS